MNTKKSFFTGLALLFGALNVCGQPTAANQRDVSYETSTAKCFKIPCDVDFDSLSPLDFVYLEAKPALIRQGKFLINNNKLSIIFTYPQMPRYERDYEFQMGKSVTDGWGTRLYYHDGEEYHYLPNEVENEGFTITAEEMETYGFFNGLFNISIPEIQQFLDSLEVPYHILGQKVLTIYTDSNERTETEMDLGLLSIETRLYKDNIHTLTNKTEYMRTGDWVIPTKKIHVYYSELPSQTRYQITEIETYLSYKVIDASGNILVNMRNNSDSFAIFVTPNPATDNIIVRFSMPINETVNIKIIDMIDNSIIAWEDMLYVSGNERNIDIVQLPPSMYSVSCTYNNKEATANFLKEGIGQYQVPLNVDIQVVPNPATDNITVNFSASIDAVMNIKIIDLMGNKYVDIARFVSGNTLSISNLSQLPAGIYYIFCTNDNWKGYTQFIKQ